MKIIKNIGNDRVYDELRPSPAAIITAFHRAIPYPLVLVAAQDGNVSLSLAHKRWSQGETGKVVIEDVHRAAAFRPDAPKAEETQFLASLALPTLPARDLFALYQGWLDRITALEAAGITGVFAPPASDYRAAALREALNKFAALRREIAVLRAQAAKEKQVNRRAELNFKIQRLGAQLASIPPQLNPETVK